MPVSIHPSHSPKPHPPAKGHCRHAGYFGGSAISNPIVSCGENLGDPRYVGDVFAATGTAAALGAPAPTLGITIGGANSVATPNGTIGGSGANIIPGPIPGPATTPPGGPIGIPGPAAS